MRVILGAGGLIGLLVVVFIIMYLQAQNAQTVLTAAKPLQETAQRLAGEDAHGMKVADSISLEPVSNGSRTDALLVKTIVPAGPMAAYFGLRAGDQIIQVGPQRVRDIGDADLAKDLVLGARMRAWTLVIRRNGAEMTLPTTAPAPSSAGMSAGDHTTVPDNRSPLQRQLESIQKVPTH